MSLKTYSHPYDDDIILKTHLDERELVPGDVVRHISDPRSHGIVVALEHDKFTILWSVPPSLDMHTYSTGSYFRVVTASIGCQPHQTSYQKAIINFTSGSI
jgi:hypothetical protein